MYETDELLEFEDVDFESSDFFDEGGAAGHEHSGDFYADEGEFDFEGDGFESSFEEWDGEFESGDEQTVMTGEPDLFDTDGESDWEDFELDGFDGFDEEDEFFKAIGRFVKKAARGVGNLVKKGVRAIGKFAGPLLKILGPVAAKIVGTAIGGPAGAAIAGTLASTLLKEAEYEDEGDAESAIEEDEALLEGIGIDQASYDLMADAAMEMSESEDEASSNRALVRMVGYGVRSFRRNRRLRPHIPKIMRAAIALARTFRANRRTRWAVQVIPLIVARTMLRLSRVRRITNRTLVEAMAHETAWVLANPARARAGMAAMRRRSRRGRRRRVRRR